MTNQTNNLVDANLVNLLFSVSDENLVLANSKLSNAQKGFELKQSIIRIMQNNDETQAMRIIGASVEELEAGKIPVKTCNEKTGEIKTKMTEPRKTAKKAISKAFGNARAVLGFSDLYQLTFKLNIASITEKTVASVDISDKVAKLFKDTIDNQGLKDIMLAVEKAQADYNEGVINRAKRAEMQSNIAGIRNTLSLWKNSGLTQELALSAIKPMYISKIDDSELTAMVGDVYQQA